MKTRIKDSGFLGILVNRRLVLVYLRIVLLGLTAAFMPTPTASASPSVQVLAEEEVYSFVSPDNGAGPLWCYGCTQIARNDGKVIVSQMETGEGVPLLCNTRWRLFRRDQTDWNLLAEADGFRQREPCPVGVLGGDLFLYVNDSLRPPGAKYEACQPYLLRFDLNSTSTAPSRIMPQWSGNPTFTDHSYRGFAADRTRRELLMLNIDARTSRQHWCHLSSEGVVLGNGSIEFPLRACYPQVALANGAAHVLAISDVVEPVEEWRAYKFERTGRQWDYVFRELYYTWTADIAKEGFAKPIEIANVSETGGHISNQDLWISPDGEAYVLYTERETQSALLRDRFFPGKSILNSLKLAVVHDGEIVSRKTLLEGTMESQPGHARFHETPDGSLFALLYVSGAERKNQLLQVYPSTSSDPAERVTVPFEKPFYSFCLATVRAGNEPSDVIDLLGHNKGGNTLSYGELRIERP